MPRRHGTKLRKPQIRRTKRTRPAPPKLARRMGIKKGQLMRVKLVPAPAIEKFRKTGIPFTAGVRIKVKPNESIGHLLQRWKKLAMHKKYAPRRK